MSDRRQAGRKRNAETYRDTDVPFEAKKIKCTTLEVAGAPLAPGPTVTVADFACTASGIWAAPIAITVNVVTIEYPSVNRKIAIVRLPEFFATTSQVGGITVAPVPNELKLSNPAQLPCVVYNAGVRETGVIAMNVGGWFVQANEPALFNHPGTSGIYGTELTFFVE